MGLGLACVCFCVCAVAVAVVLVVACLVKDGCLPWLLIPHSLAALCRVGGQVFRIWMGRDGMGRDGRIGLTCLGWRRQGRFLVQKIVGEEGGLAYTRRRVRGKGNRQTDRHRWLAL